MSEPSHILIHLTEDECRHLIVHLYASAKWHKELADQMGPAGDLIVSHASEAKELAESIEAELNMQVPL